MTSIVNGNGSTANYQTYDDIQLQQATKTLDPSTTDTIDSVASPHTLGLDYVDPYITGPGKVQLPQPASNQATTMGQIVNGLKNIQGGARTNAESLQQGITEGLNNQAIFYQAAQNQLQNIPKEDLQNLAYQPGMSDEAIRDEVLYAMMHPEASVPDNVRTLASQIYSNALNSAQQTLGAEWNPSSFAWVQDAGIMMAMQSGFDDAVAGMTNLSKDDIAQLHFAMENPDAVDALSPQLKAIFHKIMGKVQSQVQANYGIPNGWSFPQMGGSPVGLSAAFDYSFNKAIQDLVNGKKITEKQGRQLEALHYNQDADVPNASTLKKMLGSIENNVLSDLQKQWGFPPGYRPPTEASSREAMLNLEYEANFNQQLKNYSPPLTAEQQMLIRNAQGLPPPSQLSPELEAISNSVKTAALADLIEAYGLPQNWSPKVGTISNPNVINSESMLLKGLMKHAQETVDIGQKTVNSLPQTSTGNLYMAFLTAVASALSKFGEILTQSQVAQASIGKVLTQMRLDEQLNKIEKQQKALKEMEKMQKQAQKGGLGGFLMKVLTWTVNIILVVVTCGAALGLIIAAAVQGENMGSLDLITYSFKVANQVLGKPLGSWMLMIGYVAMIIITSLLAPFTFGLSLVVQAMLIAVVLVDIYVGNGSVVTNCLEACGVPENVAMIISMVVCIVVSIIIDIIVSVVIEVFTAGAGTEVTVALWAAEATLLVAKATTTIANALMKIAEVVIKIVRMLGVVGRIIEKIAEVVMQTIKALVGLLKEFIEAMINSVKYAARKAGELSDTIGSAVARKTARASERLGQISERLSETAIVRGLKRVGNTRVIKMVTDQFSIKSWNIVKELKETATEYQDMLKGLSRLTDVEYQQAKVAKLEELEKVMKELKAARSSANYTADSEEMIALNKKFDEVLQAERIVKNEHGEEEIIRGVEYYDRGLGTKMKAWNKMHETEKAYEIAKSEHRLNQAASGVKTTRWEKIKETFSLDFITELSEDVTHSAEKKQLQAAELKFAQLQEREALGGIQEADRAAFNAEKDLAEQEMKLARSNLKYKTAQEDLDRAMDEKMELFDINVMDYLIRAKDVVTNGIAAVSAFDGINRNYMEGKIAMLKAAMEAYETEMEFFLQSLKNMITRLQQSVTSLGQDFANVAKAIQQLYKTNSQTMTQLSMAA